MSDTTWDVKTASAARDGQWWYLVAAVVGLLFGHFALRWKPLLAFEGAAALVILLLCIARPYTGLLLTLALTLALDQFKIFAGGMELSPVTTLVGWAFFSNLNTTLPIPVLYLNFMEVLLITVTLSWLCRRLAAKELRWHGGTLGPALLALGLLITGAVVYGIATGAELRIALWETRALFHLMVAYLLAAHMIERRSQVRALVSVVIGAITFRILLTWWNAVGVLHLSLGGVDTVTAHEDALFFALLIVLWACLHLFRAEPRQRQALGLVMLATLGAFIFAKRRASIIALLAAVPYLTAMLHWPRARRVLGTGAFLLLLLIPYAAAFWNSDHPVALPLELVQSITRSDPGDRMGSSNRYRLIENRNLMADIRDHPWVGKGFGHQFRTRWDATAGAVEIAGELPELDYELSKYVPHNQVLWIWVKAGIFGFAAFWLFIILAVSQGTHLSRVLATPYFRALAATTAVLVCMLAIVSFVDTVMTSYRTLLLVGLLLGAMSRFRAIERAEGIV